MMSFHDPDFWTSEAQDFRRQAEQLPDDRVRQLLLATARLYDKAALLAAAMDGKNGEETKVIDATRH
jgi:hypothetical protein